MKTLLGGCAVYVNDGGSKADAVATGCIPQTWEPGIAMSRIFPIIPIRRSTDSVTCILLHHVYQKKRSSLLPIFSMGNKGDRFEQLFLSVVLLVLAQTASVVGGRPRCRR